VLWSSSAAFAEERVLLSELIDAANRRGYNIIYSTLLVPADLSVVHDENLAVTLGELRRHLKAHGLVLERAGDSGYIVAVPPAPENVADAISNVSSESMPALEEVVVSSSRYSWFGPASAPALSMSGEELSRRAVAGNDPMRVLNQLPGSASVGVSARPRVRGGRDNETLIEFDGVRLYDPFHFDAYNSLYSALDARLLDQLDFYSAAYPVNYGDRLSAAMAISPPVGEGLDNKRELGIGLFQLSYLHRTRIGDGDFFLTARRSGPEVDSFTDEADLGHPEFADLFLSYGMDGSEGARWRFNALWFGDDLSLRSEDGSEITESNTSNSYAWARQEFTGASGLERVSSLGLGHIDRTREGTINETDQVVGRLDFEHSLSFLFANQDWRLATSRGVFSGGWDYRYISADYDYSSVQQIDPAFAGLSNIDRNPSEVLALDTSGHQLAAFGNWRKELRPTLFLETGLRLDAQRYEGSWNTEPGYRLGLLYRPRSNLDLRVALGRFSQAQGLHEIEVADLDTRLYDPQVAHHAVAAVDFSLPALGLTLRMETYAKSADDVAPYYDNLSNPFTLVPELRPDRVRISPERYEARGVEFDLRGDWELLTGWLNFAYSSARDRLEERSVRRSWDQTRTLNAGIESRLGAWELSVSTSFHEGWLSTPLFFDGETVSAGERNSERFDHYLTIDAKGIRRWQTRYGDVRLEIGVTNLSNRENQIGTEQDLRDGVLESSAFYGLPRTLFADVYLSF
jgi:hypothetical protein